MYRPLFSPTLAVIGLGLAFNSSVRAQPPLTLNPTVVTGSQAPTDSFALPFSIDFACLKSIPPIHAEIFVYRSG